VLISSSGAVELRQKLILRDPGGRRRRDWIGAASCYHVKPEIVEDSKCSRRSVEINEAIQNSVISSVTADRIGREKSSEMLAFEAGIS
jgi:hypothetical protein